MESEKPLMLPRRSAGNVVSVNLQLCVLDTPMIQRETWQIQAMIQIIQTPRYLNADCLLLLLAAMHQ